MGLLDLIVAAGMAPSRSAARRLVTQGGVRVDGELQGDEARHFSAGESHEVRVGKRQAALVRLT
jgi:tyrosyl-tRNA synthetase